ncbi:MAG: hypothetical protein HYZ26_04555 [Chloroflexi bacterium]|nr:hypothetical protein [Chloroflexota bacterium]
MHTDEAADSVKSSGSGQAGGLWLTVIAALAVNLAVAAFQPSPGYMDAAYYHSGGLRLAGGEGFTEMFLWNYLDDPAGLPHPSHGYWMPLTSILAAGGIRLLPFLPPFRAAQAVMVVVAVLGALAVHLLAAQLTGDPQQARPAGLLAAFSGFYAPFLPATDAFGIYLLLGALFFLALTALAGWTGMRWMLLGGLAGLLHLARADGLLWLALALAAALWLAAPAGARPRIKACLWTGLGFLLAAGPWLARNWAVFGTPLAPGGGRALWLLDYNELFAYPAATLTFARWWAAGFDVLAGNLWLAFRNNLQTAIAVHGLVVLGPLAVWGGWALRGERPAVKAGGLAYLLTFLAMTFAFPLPGHRGGFFHSGAALMPLVWALAPVGIEQAAAAYSARRGLPRQTLRRFFTGLVVGVAGLLTLAAAAQSLPGWDAGAAHYRAIEARLTALGAQPGAMVLVNNPPGYYAETGRPAIVVPDGGEAALLAVTARYRPAYVLVEANHPDGLAGLYAAPRDLPGLRYLETFEGTHIFEALPAP